ncbi:MAG: hypothetical protein L0K77_08475, partial [Bifidobacterium crudilactis]|uniref:hypothetical protein n=1 Tax=Bifidobacterium crudilactis TaxID=327277 RepID=UPI002647F84F
MDTPGHAHGRWRFGAKNFALYMKIPTQTHYFNEMSASEAVFRQTGMEKPRRRVLSCGAATGMGGVMGSEPAVSCRTTRT